MRDADPVLPGLIDDRPDFDPRAWMAQLPPMDLFGRLNQDALSKLPDDELIAELTTIPGIGP